MKGLCADHILTMLFHDVMGGKVGTKWKLYMDSGCTFVVEVEDIVEVRCPVELVLLAQLT